MPPDRQDSSPAAAQDADAPLDAAELFDAQFLGQLRSLFFKLRKRRQMKRAGQQATPTAGHTREFKDHRQYALGDDYRAIDWRLFARLERMFVRIFEEVQEFHVHVLIDTSRSMAEPFGQKRITALRLAVALSYLALFNQHRVSLMSISDDVDRLLPPLKGQGHVHEVVRQLAALHFEGATNLVESLRRFRPSRDRRGIVFIISDLFGQAPHLSEDALRQATSWPAETHVVHVVHPEEIRPNLEGEVQLIDVETAETRRMWLTKRDMTRYTESFEAFMASLRELCVRQQMNYVPWTTDQSFEDMFLALLSRGSALAGG